MNNVKQLQNLIKKIENTASEVVEKRRMQSHADLMAKMIVTRTRQGKGVSANKSNTSKLKSLSPNYIEFRKKFKGLSSFTSPSKSNLTLTNNLLRDVKGFSRRNREAFVAFASEQGFGGLFSGFKSRPSNSKITQFQETQGRPFFYLSSREVSKLVKSVNDSIIKTFKSRFVA